MALAVMMARDKIDHILRAAGDVTKQVRFVLIGSAAIFAWRDAVPDDMAMTRDVDLFALDAHGEDIENLADELDANLGQASNFDETFGYYCDGVGPETAILPVDWQDRSKEYASENTGGVTALVPHPDDIGLAKLCAGRPKDIDWLSAAAQNGFVDLERIETLFERLPQGRPETEPSILKRRIQIVRTRSG